MCTLLGKPLLDFTYSSVDRKFAGSSKNIQAQIKHLHVGSFTAPPQNFTVPFELQLTFL